MDSQLVQLLFMPENHQHHTQALEFLHNAHTSPDSWQTFLVTLNTNTPQLDDKIKFVCLQVLENYVKGAYKNATTDSQTLLRQQLSQWMTTISTVEQQEKVFIRNKTAQILALMFVVDYDVRWPTYMSDLLALLRMGPQAADLYLKILKEIDLQLVDRETLLTQAAMDHANRLKDHLRERAVGSMTDSWHDILVQYEKSNPEVVCHCHEIIGSYISWMDITLIANERFVSVLVRHMQDPLLREAAAECLLEVITKGMEPVPKMQLIESLCNVLDSAGLLKPIDDDDSDFLVKLAKLVNGIGCQLIQAWNRMEKKETPSCIAIRDAIENKTVLLLQFLASEYDDVSGAVFDFTRGYIQMFSVHGVLTDVHKGHLENLLFILINKTKYDESYNFDQEGEDEAIFNDYRKSLRSVLRNLSNLLPDLVLKVCHEYIMATLGRWQANNWRDTEASLALLYFLGEAVPAQQGNHFSGPFQLKITTMASMMRLMATCGVSSHTHPAVTLQFFDCVSRYEKFFLLEPQHIAPVAEAYLDHRGIRNPSPRVRSRCSYLFCRFVRCVKHLMVPFIPDIFSQLQPLLVVSTTRSNTSTRDLLLTLDDQLFIYEAASMLVMVNGSSGSTTAATATAASSSNSNSAKCLHMTELLSPVLATAERLAQALPHSTPPQQAVAANVICHCMAITNRTSKGFSSQTTMRTNNCFSLYISATKLFIDCLNLGIERETIGSGVRQFLHRMIVCLEPADMIPLFAAASQTLLLTPSLHHLTEYLPLINQLASKAKSLCSEFMKSILSHLVYSVFAAVNSPADGSDEDDARQRRYLQRYYYALFTTLASHDLAPVLTTLDQQLLDQILMSVIQGAVEFPDPSAQKSCFITLRHLIKCWAGSDNAPSNFISFLYTQVVPACFLAPLKSTFNLEDATTLQALYESGNCLKTLHDKRGDELINYLRNQYFPTMNLAPHLVNAYLNALVADDKFFRNHLKIFFESVK
uniref:Exportin-T n=3 Tax=Hirondellea gigas TaxID=1518452 RepID=A0A6A7FWH1_9CRUS